MIIKFEINDKTIVRVIENYSGGYNIHYSENGEQFYPRFNANGITVREYSTLNSAKIAAKRLVRA